MPDTPLVGAIAPAAGAGTGLALTALGSVGGPVGAAIGAGVGALISLIGDIGSGRRDANQMTENGGPQDILNKQLAAISANYGSVTPQEAQQATQIAWSQFIQAANQFAAKGPEFAQVAKQAIFQTPQLTQTVQKLGGFDPLGNQFTSQISPSIPGATPQSGISLGQTLGAAGAGVGGAVAGSAINGAMNPGTNAMDSVNLGTGSTADGGPTFGPDVPPDVTSGVGGGGGSVPGVGGNNSASSSVLNQIFGKNPISSILGIGTSVLNGVLQSNAAKGAAALQSNAANNAAQLEATTAANNLAFAKQVYGDQQTANAPFLQAGQNALSQIQNLIAPGGKLDTTFTAPTEAQVQQTPGYQLQLDEAMKALGNTTKGVTSGATIKAADRFATDYADTHYQDALNNALQIYQTNRNNTLNPLLTLAGFGPQAVQANNQSGNNDVNATTSISTNAAQDVGNLGQQAAAATAAGNTGSVNAITGAATNASNTVENSNILNTVLQLLNNNNSVTANRQSSVYA